MHNEIQHARLFEHLDARTSAHARHQRARDFDAGLVAMRMHDALARVRRLSAQAKAPGARVEVECGAGRLKLADASGPLLHQHFHGRCVAKRGASSKGVAPVQFG